MIAARTGVFRWSGVVAMCLLGAGTTHAAEVLAIRARPAKTPLLVGEPLVLSMTFTGAPELYWRRLSGENRNLRVLVDRGAGFAPYAPKAWMPEPLLESAKAKMPEKRGYREETLAYDANLGDWIFPAPASYRLVVEYQDEKVGTVRSNVVSIAVRAPDGDEKIVHDALRRMGPSILGQHQPNAMPAELQPLVDRYPNSVYLQEVRLNDLERRVQRIAEGFDPDDPEGPRPKDRQERQRLAKRRTGEMLAQVGELSDNGGQFQPEALRLMAQLQALTDDEEGQRHTLERIVREFPDRAAAKAAREELADRKEEDDDSAGSPPPKQ